MYLPGDPARRQKSDVVDYCLDVADEEIHLGIDGIGPATLLGRGGSAFVYLAEQTDFGRKVAVKVLFDALEDDATYRRFDRECRAVGAVSDHPNIVVVHGRGLTADERPYLVMEYRAGGSLAERIAVRGRIPEAEAVEVGIKIGSALQVAHDAGVLHRDIKPANILLSTYNEPALADFGIARMEGSHKTTEGLFSASVAHASREILDSGDPTPRSDVYALASTMFELVTGSPAYVRPDDSSMWSVINRVLGEDPPDPADHGVSPGLAAVLRRAMSHDPAARHEDATAFVADLRSLTSGRGLAASASTEPVPTIAAAPEPTTTNTTVAADNSPTVSRTGAVIAVAAVIVATVAAAAVALLVANGQSGLGTPADETAATEVGRATVISAFSGSDDLQTTDSPIVAGPAADDGGASLTAMPDQVFPRSGIGPLEAGGRYVLQLDVMPEAAGYRIVIDGRKTTEYQSSIPVFFPKTGRHQLQLQIAVDEQVHLTDPVEIYVAEPPQPGWRANLSAIRSRPENWPEALRQFDQLVLDGHDDLELSLSTRSDQGEFPYWNYYVDGFGDDRVAAQDYCDRFNLGPEQCFIAEV